MKLCIALAALTAAANAHYVFPRLTVNGAQSNEWDYVRQTANYQSNGPVQDVNSASMTCYELSPGRGAPKTASVAAGSTVTFSVRDVIGHPGPLAFYMAKVPSGQTAASFNGKGNVWFKIYQDGPKGLGTSSITWPTNGAKSVSVTLPKCLTNGDYLLRVEHIGLHGASTVGQAQFYIACAQLTVTGGSGGLNTGSLVALPGAYRSSDPGILFNLYYPVPTQYINPGPAVVKC